MFTTSSLQTPFAQSAERQGGSPLQVEAVLWAWAAFSIFVWFGPLGPGAKSPHMVSAALGVADTGVGDVILLPAILVTLAIAGYCCRYLLAAARKGFRPLPAFFWSRSVNSASGYGFQDFHEARGSAAYLLLPHLALCRSPPEICMAVERLLKDRRQSVERGDERLAPIPE